jgi:hypothetical protein
MWCDCWVGGCPYDGERPLAVGSSQVRFRVFWAEITTPICPVYTPLGAATLIQTPSYYTHTTLATIFTFLLTQMCTNHSPRPLTLGFLEKNTKIVHIRHLRTI